MEGGETRYGKKAKGEGGVGTEAAGEFLKQYICIYITSNHIHVYLDLFIMQSRLAEMEQIIHSLMNENQVI